MNLPQKNAKSTKMKMSKFFPLCPLRSFAAILSLSLSFGCASLKELGVQPPVAPYQPQNVHRAVATLPQNVQRLAVLPLAGNSARFDSSESCHELETVLHEAVAATKKFEVRSEERRVGKECRSR